MSSPQDYYHITDRSSEPLFAVVSKFLPSTQDNPILIISVNLPGILKRFGPLGLMPL